jgi:hypothetical protein
MGCGKDKLLLYERAAGRGGIHVCATSTVLAIKAQDGSLAQKVVNEGGNNM